MRKLIFGLLLLILTISMTACMDAPPEAASVPDSAAFSSSHEAAPGSTDVTEVPALENILFNHTLLLLIGATNAEVKQAYSGACYAHINGMGAAELFYDEPYLSFVFAHTENPMLDAWAEGGEGGVYEANPLADNLLVSRISLQGAYDAATHTVTSQESLQLFYNTETQISYTLLTEALQQTPKLLHLTNALYAPIIPFDPETRTPGQEIAGGVYQAVYKLNPVQATVLFVKENASYIAFNITLEKIEASKLN